MRRLLDLFCGAGGAAYGYMLAGFHVTGVDMRPQPHYKGNIFIEGDALEYLAAHGQEYVVVHASPPCQAYSALKHLARREHPILLITPVRKALRALGKPYVIENVVGAPLDTTLLLCGSMFGLRTSCGAQLRRHRLFESNVLLMSPGHCQHDRDATISIHGKKADDPRREGLKDKRRPIISVHGGKARDRSLNRTITVTGNTPQQNVERNRIRETFSIKEARIAMGIDWMGMKELSQAIPPAYTQWIGAQL